nr:hypothetical protein CFP56_76688 [Quercus suber]
MDASPLLTDKSSTILEECSALQRFDPGFPPITKTSAKLLSTGLSRQDEDRIAKETSEVRLPYISASCGVEASFVLAQALGAHVRECDKALPSSTASKDTAVRLALQAGSPAFQHTANPSNAFRAMVAAIKSQTTLFDTQETFPEALECWHAVASGVPGMTFHVSNITFCCAARAEPPILHSYIPAPAGVDLDRGFHTVADVCTYFFDTFPATSSCSKCYKLEQTRNVIVDRLPLFLLVEWQGCDKSLSDLLAATEFHYFSKDGIGRIAQYSRGRSRGALISGMACGFNHIKAFVMPAGPEAFSYTKDSLEKGGRKVPHSIDNTTEGVAAVILRRQIDSDNTLLWDSTDDPHKIIGPTWHKSNSCWIDTAIWVAKVIGLAQRHDSSAIAQDRLQQELWNLLRTPWHTDVTERCHALGDQWRAMAKLKADDYGPAVLFFELMAYTLPSTTAKLQLITACRTLSPPICQQTLRAPTSRTTIYLDFQFWRRLEQLPSEASISDIMQAYFSAWQEESCSICKNERTTYRATNALPPILAVATMPWPKDPVILLVEFRYYDAQAIKQQARYRVRAMILGSEMHFVGVLLSYYSTTGTPGTDVSDALVYDGQVMAGKPRCIPGTNVEPWLREQHRSGWQITLLVLEASA